MSQYHVLLLTLLSMCLPLVIAQGGEVTPDHLALDCQELKDINGETADGEYKIYPYPGGQTPTPENQRTVRTYCEGMGGEEVWTVIQRHQSAESPFYFNKTWELYKLGFGVRSKDFWIGNKFLHSLTTGRKYTLRVEIDTWDSGLHRYADYADFGVGSEAEKYKLHVGNYSGNAGDALKYHNGVKFSTIDQDNDNWDKQCTKMLAGGWWFNRCAHSNLNGQAYQGFWRDSVKYWGGVWWLPMHPTENNYELYFQYSVKSVMKIKRDGDPPAGFIA